MSGKSESAVKKRKPSKSPPPTPLLKAGVPLDWWFIFKFNAAEEPEASLPTGSEGAFDKPGWKDPSYETKPRKHSQHFVGASSKTAKLQHMKGYLGTSREDPLGDINALGGPVIATFDNEPSNAHMFHTELPDAMNCWLKTRWDPADQASTEGLIALPDFRH